MEFVRRLHLAVKASDIEGIEAAIAAGADVDQAWGVHGTPLCLAIGLGSLDMVTLLVRMGADINQGCFDGISPLGMAIRELQVDITHYLLNLPGCDVNACDPVSKQSVVHDAVMKRMTTVVEALVQHPSCDVSKGNGVGNTALHLALMHKQTEIAKILSRCENLHFVHNYAGHAAVHLVAALGFLEGLQVLFPRLARTTESEVFSQKMTVCAGREGGWYMDTSGLSPSQQRKLDQKATFTGDTALHIAVREKQYEIAHKLVSLGAAVDIQNNCGQTALLLACAANDGPLVQELLRAGAPPNVKGLFRPRQEQQPSLLDTLARESHLTPLHVAAATDNLSVVKMLLDFDADVNICDDHGRCPLHMALLSKASKVALYLAMHSKQQVLVDQHGSSLLHGAARCLDHAAELTEALLIMGCSTDCRDRSGNLPLHEAVCFENLEMVHMLLEYGADGSALDMSGSSTLTIAASTGRLDMAVLLVAAGAHLDSQEPLREALDAEGVELVKFLVDAGCSLSKEKYLFADRGNAERPARFATQQARDDSFSTDSSSSSSDDEADFASYDACLWKMPHVLRHNKELLGWLQERARNAKTLSTLCLEAVRSHFRHGDRPFHAMRGLPLPEKVVRKLFFEN